MNKNLLFIGAAGALYWYVRNQSSASTAATNSLTTGAASYVPPTAPPTTAPASSWLTTAVNTATQGVSLVKTVSTAWSDIKGALQQPVAAPATADVTADSSGGIWAGPAVS